MNPGTLIARADRMIERTLAAICSSHSAPLYSRPGCRGHGFKTSFSLTATVSPDLYAVNRKVRAECASLVMSTRY
jgi:hypothetical protein